MADLYCYTYYYGNGDYYTGYGFAWSGNFTTGQSIGVGEGNLNETGLDGYYNITYVESNVADDSLIGKVFVNGYYDVETGFPAFYISDAGTGNIGLGSESGYAYGLSQSNSNSYFGRDYYEADLDVGFFEQNILPSISTPAPGAALG